MLQDRDVTGEGFATVGKIAKCGHKTDANLTCDTVEEGVWLTALGYSDERGEGFDSQGMYGQTQLIGKWLS